MASALYPSYRQKALDGDVSWRDDDWRVILVDSADYSYSAAHAVLTDVPVAARVAVSGSLAGKTSANGVADANDFSYPNVAGDSAEILLIYRHTGNEATSDLCAYIDTSAGGAALSVSPNGNNIDVTWDNGPNKIFKL